MAVQMSQEVYDGIVDRLKKGDKRADIAEAFGIPRERVEVVASAEHLRGKKAWARYGASDIKRVAGWIEASSKSGGEPTPGAAAAKKVAAVKPVAKAQVRIAASARKAATPGPKRAAKPRARRRSK